MGCSQNPSTIQKDAPTERPIILDVIQHHHPWGHTVFWDFPADNFTTRTWESARNWKIKDYRFKIYLFVMSRGHMAKLHNISIGLYKYRIH